jgi:molybdate transport system substrate-binding protein
MQALRRCFLIGLFALAACGPQVREPAKPVTVFAAASLNEALTEIGSRWEAETGQPVRLSFAASGSVARQIEAGAPADVVVLADRPWMDRLAKAERIESGSRIDLLRNRLVLIAPADAPRQPEPLASLQGGNTRLVIGDPESVPAGAYAREWLQSRGLWTTVQSRLATATDVRAVRSFVQRGEAGLGIVYRSDVVGASDVRVVFEPPASEQPDIVYPAALTATSASARPFLDYLRGPEAAAIFRERGFEPVISP